MEGRQLAELAALAGLSRYQLIRAFRRATGMTTHAWQINQRVNMARERLRAGPDYRRTRAGHLGERSRRDDPDAIG